MNILFNDRIAFSYDRLPFYDASVTARYSGKSEIFHATTIIGNVLARRKVNSHPTFGHVGWRINFDNRICRNRVSGID